MNKRTDKIGWSNFARSQNSVNGVPQTWLGTEAELLKLVHNHWDSRIPGAGRKDTTQVCIVTITNPTALTKVRSCWIPITKAHDFQSQVVKRQPNEDPYILTTALGPTLTVTSLKVVLYSRTTLLENNGETSGNFDWEIVAILPSCWENEPMNPLTMARNFLEKTGGTYVNYPANLLAESIYFWSQYVKAR